MIPSRPRASTPDGPTPEELWDQVDRFISAHFVVDDPALEEALRTSAAEGLPSIQITPVQGKMLHILARAIGAQRVLEIGTLGGYSAIWLARAVGEGGRVLTLEKDPRHADVARRNLARAGVGDRVEVRVGDAGETLPRLLAEGGGPFDMIFLDADRPRYDEHLGWAVRLGRPGTLIVVDNVVKQGAILDPDPTAPGMVGLRRFIDWLAQEPGVEAIEVQTVGSKGHDGFALALVTGSAHSAGSGEPSGTPGGGAPRPTNLR
jgi:predicted O-methyltransferase YrrM